MAGLFDYKDYKVVINPDEVAIPPFIEIWNRDKSKNKDTAVKEISYIWFLCNFKSPYNVYNDEEKEWKIRNDFLKDDSWRPDTLIKEGIEKYKEFTNTSSMKFLASAKKALSNLQKYFDNINWAKLDEKGRPVYKVNDVVAALAKAGFIMESLDKVQKRVEQEIEAEAKIRGDKKIKGRER